MIFGGRSSRKTLVILTEGLREFVNADAAFRALRGHHAEEHLTLLTTVELGRLAKAAPYFDRVFTDGDPIDGDGQATLAKKLKKEGFSQVYDLDRSRAALGHFAMFRPFPPKWSGIAPGAKFSIRARELEGLTPPEANARQLEAAGVEAAAVSPDLFWALEARKDAANMKPSWYGLSGDFGLLAPSREDDAGWPADRWAELASLLADFGVVPVLIGARKHQKFANLITRRCPSLVNLAGKTDLLQAAALAREAQFYLGDPDAELIHLCASVGCPGVMMSGREPNAELLAPRGGVLLRAERMTDIPSPDVLQTLRNLGCVRPPDAAPREALT